MNIEHSKKSVGSLFSSGFWKVFMITLVLSVPLTTLNAQNNNNPYCNMTSSDYGFLGDPACQAAVCADDSYCCDSDGGNWDGLCASATLEFAECNDCLSPACTEAQEFAGFPYDLDCQTAVCDVIPDCCTEEWDEDCAALAFLLSFEQGEGSGPCATCALGNGIQDPPNTAMFCDEFGTGPGFPGNPVCEAFICDDDAFCCEVLWDDICAGAAAVADECITCRSDYVAPQIPTLSQWGLIILTFLLLQGIWFTAVFKPAAPLKVIPAMWLEGMSYIKNNMVWFLPILVLTTLVMSLLYFAGMAQSADIIGAPLTLIILAPSLYWYGKMQSAKTA